jgi:WD40 repeat protein
VLPLRNCPDNLPSLLWSTVWNFPSRFMAMPETRLTEAPPPKYWAFLSYSQRDKQWSDWLRRSIENYRVPRRLGGRQSRDGAVPRRLFPVFRDREELPTSANLGSNIEEALRASRYLIVVCSPNGAASRWVNEEIRAFKAMGREDRVLAVIVDGEPNASDQPDSGVPECFPKAIRYRIGAEGELTQERTEPIAADVRPDKDGRDNARLKILAGLLGVGFDELRQRDRARHRRRLILAAAAAMGIIAALAGTWFLQERAKKRDVDRQLASKYEERARARATKGDEAGAALFFAEANHLDPTRARRDAVLFHLQPLALPLLNVELGERISCVAFDPTRRRFLTMGEGLVRDRAEETIPAKARVWDAETGVGLVEFSVDNNTYSFRRAYFTRDGTRIFTALENARLWDAESGKPIGPPIPFNAIQQGGGESSHVDRAGLDPTEKKVVLKWDQNFVQSWDAETSQPLDKVEYRPGEWPDLAFLWRDDPVPKFSPDATISLQQSDFGPIQLIEVGSGKKIGEPLRQQVDISAAAVSPRNDLMATGGSDGVAYLWRINGGRSEVLRSAKPMLHPGAVSRVKFSPDGAFILTTSGATAYLWNSLGQLEMVMPNSAEIEAEAFSADGQRVLTGAKDGTAFVWNVAERRMLPRAIAHEAWKEARVMMLSPDGRSLFTQAPSESGQTHLRLWDVRSGAPLWDEVEHAPVITVVAFSPDGSTVATVDHTPIPRDEPYRFGEDVPEKKTVRVWNAKTGSAIGDHYEITGRSGGDSETPETVIAFGADGSRLLLVHNEFLPPVQTGGGLAAQAKLQLLDGRTGRVLREPLIVDGHVTGAIFLRSGEILLARKRDGVVSWPAGQSGPSEEPLVKMERILSVALSPDEKTLLTVARDEARLWDFKSRQPIGAPLQVFDLVDFAPRKKSGMTEIHNAAFSPDGRIAVTTAGREMRLWDARTGESVGQPFPLGELPMFGQTPRFVEGAHLLAPGRGVLWDKNLSWLLRDVSAEQILLEAQLFSRRRMRSDGASEIIPPADWKAKRALWTGRQPGYP